jgi:hypothetical protein
MVFGCKGRYYLGLILRFYLDIYLVFVFVMVPNVSQEKLKDIESTLILT